MKNKIGKSLLFLVCLLTFVMALSLASFAAETGNVNSDGTLTYSFENGVLTIGGTAEVFSLSDVNYAKDNLPWAAFRESITSVVVKAPVVELGDFCFFYLTKCTSIEIPSTVTKISGKGVFQQCQNLNTVSVTENSLGDGIIDFRFVESIGNYAFDDALINTNPILLFGRNLSFGADKFCQNNTKGIIIKVFPGSATEDAVNNVIKKAETSDTICKKIKLEYLDAEYYPVGSEEAAILSLSGSVIWGGASASAAPRTAYEWTFDKESGTLTITNSKNANELMTTLSGTLGYHSSNGETGISGKAATEPFRAWKAAWKKQVKHIVVDYFKKISDAYGVESVLSGYPNLETILLESGKIEFQSGTGVFANNPSLKKIGQGTLPEKNIAKITDFNKFTDELSANYMFSNCTSLEGFELSADFTLIGNETFKNCTSLTDVTISESIAKLGTNAFAGCTNLTNVTILNPDLTENKSFDDVDTLKIVCASADQKETIDASYENVKVVFGSDAEIKSAVSFEGFSIRLKDYNGLRGMFKMNPAVKNDGLTLKEYGAVVISKDKYNETRTLTLDNGEYVYSDGAKIRVWDKDLGFVRENGTPSVYSEDGDGNIMYSIAITNYTDVNYDKYIYMAGYSIYTDGESDFVSIEGYPDEDYKFFSIYNITLDMYIAGFVNASNSDKTAVWDLLLMGAAEFKAGSNYTYTEGMTDLDGNDAFSEKFTFAEITVCNQSKADGVITYTPCGDVTVTLLKKFDNSGNIAEYVAVYRSEGGNGVLPTMSGPYDNPRTVPQYTGSFASGSGKVPNPKLASAITDLVKTVIVDDGIVELSSCAFAFSEKTEKYVFAESLKNANGDSTFVANRVLKTVYFAHPGDVNFVPEEGTLDLSGFEEFSTAYTFNGCNDTNGFEKIILPDSCKSAGVQFASGASNLKTVFVFDPDNFTVDNTSFKSDLSVQIVKKN